MMPKQQCYHITYSCYDNLKSWYNTETWTCLRYKSTETSSNSKQ